MADFSEDSDSEDRGEGGSVFSIIIGKSEDRGVGGKNKALVVTCGRYLGAVTGLSAAALEDVMVMLMR